MKKEFMSGLKAGFPIGLGYLSVSITFGIMAISAGLHWWQALLISMFTLTSAGQVASLSVIINPGRYFELLLSQCTINVRYSFMSIALSQKTDSMNSSGAASFNAVGVLTSINPFSSKNLRIAR